MVFLFSCEKEEFVQENEIVQENNSNNFIIQDLSTTEIKSQIYSKQLFKYIEKNSNLSQRGGEEAIYYEIDTHYAKYMESRDGQYHSYTHYVMNTPKGKGLENIVFSSKLNGSYDVYLVHYDISAETISRIAQGGGIDLETIEVNTYTMDNDFNVEDLYKGAGCTQITIQVAFCTEGNHPDGIGTQEDPCTASSSYNEYYYVGSGCGGGTGTGLPPLPDFPNETSTPGSTPTNGNPTWGGGGAGGEGGMNPDDIATTMYISLESLRKKNFRNSLSQQEKECLDSAGNNPETEDKVDQMWLFLEADSLANLTVENYFPDDVNFAKEALGGICDVSDVDWENRIIKELVGKEKCLDDHLNESGNNFVQELLANFEGDDSEFGINIKSKNQVFYTDESGDTSEVNGLTSYTSTSNIIDIEISTSKANNGRALQVVRTLLHEYIHADIFRKLYSENQSIELTNFRNTFNSFENNNFEPSQSHQTMAALYINSLKDALKSYHMTVMTGDYNYLSNNGQHNLDAFYKAIAWQGLKNQNVQAWIDLPQNQKDEIDQAYQQYIFATTHNCPN